jgi:hypothetical protein
MIERVIAGGQTGADQAGWRAARASGIATWGFMPLGFLTEDGPRPEFAESRAGLAEKPKAGVLSWPEPWNTRQLAEIKSLMSQASSREGFPRLGEPLRRKSALDFSGPMSGWPGDIRLACRDWRLSRREATNTI